MIKDFNFRKWMKMTCNSKYNKNNKKVNSNNNNKKILMILWMM